MNVNGNYNKSWINGYGQHQPVSVPILYTIHHPNTYPSVMSFNNFGQTISNVAGFSNRPQQQHYTQMCLNGPTLQNQKNSRKHLNKYSNAYNWKQQQMHPQQSTNISNNNNNGFINGIKNFVNGFMNSKQTCDYSDHHRRYNAKFRNNLTKNRRKDQYGTISLEEQQYKPQLPSPHIKTFFFNFSVQPQNITTKHLEKTSTENDKKNTNSEQQHESPEIVAIFTSEDFPELPAPKQRANCDWDKKSKETCSFFGLNGSFKCENNNRSCNKKQEKKFSQDGECDKNKISKNHQQNRKESECDSEDSFVIFTKQSPPKYQKIVDYCHVNGNSGTVKVSIPCKSTAGATPFRPKIRERQISECSDDSFVICFTDDAAEGVIGYEGISDSSEESDIDTDDDSDDESYDSQNNEFTVVKEHKNQKTENNFDTFSSDAMSQPDSGFDDVKDKKVRFKLDVEVHVMYAWNFAYRAARKGHWENYARDRSRFKYRVERLSTILNSVLDSKHRENIYKLRFCDNNNSNLL